VPLVRHGEEIFDEAAGGLAFAHAALLHDHVFFLVELTEDRVREAVVLERRPRLELVRRQRVDVHRLIERGEGVQAERPFLSRICPKRPTSTILSCGGAVTVAQLSYADTVSQGRHSHRSLLTSVVANIQ